MHTEHIDFSETDCFDSAFLDYISGKSALKPFYGHGADLLSFEAQIKLKQKQFSREKREVLAGILTEQYAQLEPQGSVLENIHLLEKNNTFTLITGHQLNIYTGPLYFIYKIVTVIKAAKKLKARFPDYHFVPMYWMASEDHDLDEIAFLNYDGRKVKWETEQKGPVGLMNTEGLAKLGESFPRNAAFMRESYEKEKNLARAVRSYVHHLFADEGLLVIDANDQRLKQQIKPIITDDLIHHHANGLVEKQSARLADLGYKVQGFPREINFFYMQSGLRERIVKTNEGAYQVMNTTLCFSKEEMLEEVEQHPERFSPNVMMRPLYQECILPNLSYTGGPAEIAYWLQLKPVFDYYEQAFPILLPRNFAMVINTSTARKIKSLGLSTAQLFGQEHHIAKWLVQQITPRDITVETERSEVLKIFDLLAEKGETIDPKMKRTVAGFAQKTIHYIDALEKKFIRAEKRQHTIIMQQLQSVKTRLFPNGGLQERTDNFLNFYGHDSRFVEKIKTALDPFELKFHVIWLDE